EGGPRGDRGREGRRRARRRSGVATSHAPRREADRREPGEHAPRLGPAPSNRNRRDHRINRTGRGTPSDPRSPERGAVRARAGQGGGLPHGLGGERSRPNLINYSLTPL